MLTIFRKFLRDFPVRGRELVRLLFWLGILGTVIGLFMAKVVGEPWAGSGLKLAARKDVGQSGLEFPLADELTGFNFARLQAMNVAPVTDGGLAIQWYLMSWPNQWFERFPLTLDQNFGNAHSMPSEEMIYWRRNQKSNPKGLPSFKPCPLASPTTPASFRLWDSTISTSGEHLGELLLSDSLADLQHRDLASTVRLFQSDNTVNQPPDAHGTHMAGVISALRNGEGIIGVIPGLQIRLFPLRLSHLRDGPRVYGDHLLENLDSIQAVLLSQSGLKERANRVILLSWSLFESDGIDPRFLEKVRLKLNQILQHDVVVVVPAGNFENGRSEQQGGRVFPASWASELREHRGVLLPVASLNYCSRPSWFSNYAVNDLGTVLFAPGERIYSTLPNNDYGFLSGTSASAAQVAAVLTMTAFQFPDVEMKTQVHTLIRTSNPIPNQPSDRMIAFDAPSLVQGLMAEFGWIARH